MAISEGLQKRINNLTSSMASPMGGMAQEGTMGGGMGAISDQDRQMFMDSIPQKQYDVEIDGKDYGFGFDSQPTDESIQALMQQLQVTTEPEEA